jgi:two-component system sensor histidine kinase TctE
MEIARELALHIKRGETGLTFDLESDAERTLLLDEYDKIYFTVRDTGGKLIAGDAVLAQTVDKPAPGTDFQDGSVHGEDVRVATLPVRFGTQVNEPAAMVQVAETRVKRRALAQEILIDVILPQLAMIVIAGVLVWVGVARGLSPLRHLRQAVAERSHLDLSPVAANDVPTEVVPLLDAINDLMQRLGVVLTFQNRFIADAAHQLRTPVAGLKAHIEVALGEEDLTQTRRALAHLYSGVERMSRLVSQLLSLARNEANTGSSANFSALDLTQLAFEVTTEWVPEAYKKNIDLGFEGAGQPVLINGDRITLTEMMNNLLDNAIRYSRDGGRVTVRVVPALRPRLTISDDGPSIPAGERQRVFERFHRLLGNHTDGSGLGLAIVREIAVRHHAEITLDDDADGVGNTFAISFPEYSSP